MIHVKVSDAQRRELEQVSHQAVGRVALRAHMVLLSARGYSVPQIAAIHDCGCDVVRTWLHRYEQEGVAGLEDAPRSGRPPKDPLAGRISATQASQAPECSGHVQTCWTVGLLTAFLARRFRVLLSRSSVRRYLQRLDWRWARPRLAPAHKTDPQASGKEAALAAAQAAAAQGRAHLVYLDECDLHLLPLLRALWMKGARVRVPTPGTNARRAFCGAREAVSGQWFSTDQDRTLAVHCGAFLRQSAAAYPTGPLSLAMDTVTMHDAKVVRAWLAAHPRVQVLWLPKDAAHEVNPVERIWGLMKADVAAKRLAGRIAELAAQARRFFADLAAHPVDLPRAA
jgi:transposase